MRIRIASVVGAMVLLLAACGGPVGEVGGSRATAAESADVPVESDADLHVIVMPDVDGGLSPDVTVGCRAGPSFPAAALEEVLPIDDAELPGLEDAVQSFLGNEEGQFWPQDGWRVLHATEQTVLIVHHDSATGGVSFMNFESQNGSWRRAGASSGGPCPLQTLLPAGHGVVEWRIDPAGPPLSPESTSIPVLVTE